MYTLVVIALWLSNTGSIEPEVISEQYDLSLDQCVQRGENFPLPEGEDVALTYMCVQGEDYDTE